MQKSRQALGGEQTDLSSHLLLLGSQKQNVGSAFKRSEGGIQLNIVKREIEKSWKHSSAYNPRGPTLMNQSPDKATCGPVQLSPVSVGPLLMAAGH